MLDALVMRLARTTAAGLDVPAVLADVCSTAQAVLGVRGVVVAVARRGEVGLGPLAGSDDVAAWIGRLQCGPRGEPLTGVARFGRAVLTTDLARVGSPELAAAAAATGLTGLMTVPLVAGGVSVGALQLLGNAANPVGPARVEPLAGVLEVLAARLADVDELRRLSAPCVGLDPGGPRDQVDTAAFAAVRPEPALGRAGVDVPTVLIRLPESPAWPQTAVPMHGGTQRERRGCPAGTEGPVGPALVGSSPLVRLLCERRGGPVAPLPAAADGSAWEARTGRLVVVEDDTARMAVVNAAALPAPSDEQPISPVPAAEDAVHPAEGASEPGPGARGVASATSDERADRAAEADPASPGAVPSPPIDERRVDLDAPDESVTEPAPLGAGGDRDVDGQPTPPGSAQPEPPLTVCLPEILVPLPRRREPGTRRPSPVARPAGRQVCHLTGSHRGARE
jgi:hypothetical protein